VSVNHTEFDRNWSGWLGSVTWRS